MNERHTYKFSAHFKSFIIDIIDIIKQVYLEEKKKHRFGSNHAELMTAMNNKKRHTVYIINAERKNTQKTPTKHN